MFHLATPINQSLLHFVYDCQIFIFGDGKHLSLWLPTYHTVTFGPTVVQNSYHYDDHSLIQNNENITKVLLLNCSFSPTLITTRYQRKEILCTYMWTTRERRERHSSDECFLRFINLTVKSNFKHMIFFCFSCSWLL